MADMSLKFANLRASNFVFDYDLEHPNKMPFSGILTYFDVPSDQAPHGSGGRKVMIPSEVGIPALDGLVGMAVNYLEGSMDDHNPQNKIGIITSAETGERAENGTPVYVQGFIYANDFPDAALDIKINQSTLGFSYETTNTLLMDDMYEDEPIAVVTQVIFTGASILFAADAAYQSTTLAASAETENNESEKEETENKEKEGNLSMEQIEQILAAIQGLKDYVDMKFENFKKEDEAEDALDDAIEDAQEAQEDVEESTEVQASTEDVTTAEEAEVSTELQTEETELNAAAELKAELEAVKKELADLKAAADIQAAARKSIVYPVTLMQKYELPEEEETSKLMASIDSRDDLSIGERLALKIELREKQRKQQSK